MNSQNTSYATILIVGSESEERTILYRALTDRGYDCISMASILESIELCRNHPLDLVLTSLYLPDGPANELCRRLRQFSNLPVIVSGNSMDVFDEISCLESGADDYIRVGSSESILFARVRALLRRTRAKSAEVVGLKVGEVLIDASRFQATCKGEIMSLTQTEFKLLSLLASNIGKTLSRSDILGDVWQTDFVGENRIVDSHVRNLRSKLSQHPTNLVIVAARGVGYRLVLERSHQNVGPNHRKNGPLPVLHKGITVLNSSLGLPNKSNT